MAIIVDAVSQLQVRAEEEGTWDFYTLDPESLAQLGVTFVQSVQAARSPEPAVTWSIDCSGEYREAIQDSIGAKVPKLESYRECGAKATWLLLVGGPGLGGFGDIVEGRSRAFISPFDRTLLLFHDECIELNTTIPGEPV